MQLVAGDVVATFDVVEPGGDLLVITQHGYGKRTSLTEYPSHGRNTGGQWTLAHTRLDETGKIAAAHVVQPEDQVSVITSNGIALRTPVAAISQMSRMTRGVRIVNLDGNDTVAAMARLAAAVEEGEAVTKDEGRRMKARQPQTADRGPQTGEQSEAETEGEALEAELALTGNLTEESG